MSKTSPVVIRWVVMFAWAEVIIFLSSQTRLNVIPPVSQLDKAVHFCAYGLLAGLCFRAFSPDGSARISAWLMVLAVVLVSAFGVMEEFHQKTIPGRTFEEFDMVANALGAIAAAVLWRPATKRYRWLG